MGVMEVDGRMPINCQQYSKSRKATVAMPEAEDQKVMQEDQLRPSQSLPIIQAPILQPMDAYATSNGSICSACPSTRLPPARGICYQWQPTLEPNIKSERCSHWQEGRLYQEICGMETVTIRNITTINGATTSKVGQIDHCQMDPWHPMLEVYSCPPCLWGAWNY